MLHASGFVTGEITGVYNPLFSLQELEKIHTEQRKDLFLSYRVFEYLYWTIVMAGMEDHTKLLHAILNRILIPVLGYPRWKILSILEDSAKVSESRRCDAVTASIERLIQITKNMEDSEWDKHRQPIENSS